MTLKLQDALHNNEGMSIVEFARSLRNAEYSKWEEGQRLPEGMARVNIDSRPFGEYDAIFKNYDYVRNPIDSLKHPDVGFYRKMSDKKIIKRQERMRQLEKIASKYGI